MRVVFIRSNPVSPDPRVEKEVKTLKKHHYDVQVIAWDRSNKYKNKTEMLPNIPNVKITRFGIPAIFGGGFKKNFFPLLTFQYRIIKWLFENRKQYDVIHAADFDTALSSLVCAKIFRKKIIYDIFDSVTAPFNGPKLIGKLVEKIDIHMMNQVDAVIICTELRREQIKKATPKRIQVIHNTPSPINSIKKLHLNENKIKIVYVGVLYSSRFIEELAIVVTRNPHYELHIGGFGELEKEFENLAKQYDNIIYYGKIAYEKTLELESNCDIMTAIYDPELQNHYYAAPNKFYEALMLGKPLIMVNNTGMSHIVAEHDIGELMDYSIESLEEALKRLVERRDEWPEIGKKMQILYKHEYSWSEMENRLVNVYKELDGV